MGAGALTEDMVSHDCAAAQTDETTKDGSSACPARIANRHTGVVRIFPRQPTEECLTWQITDKGAAGRSREALIRVDDKKVSRLHAVFEVEGHGLKLTDVASRHGTFVNGRVLEHDAKVIPGDVIRLGDTLLLVTEDVNAHQAQPRTMRGASLGLERDVIAGPRFAEAIDHAARVSELDYPILLLGESGTGKEILARVIHAARKNGGPFVGINIAAIPPTLFEAELFGHDKGAFTGANVARHGAFREAHGGVLFLDEVADLPFELQAKLLRVIDLQQVRPIGASSDVPIKVRVVAATSRDLREACETGSFRPDLYYRLAGVVIQIPPLRERRDEILLLALAMLGRDAPSLRLTPDAAELLVTAPWKGNVRNLRRAVTHAVSAAVTAKRTDILPSDLPDLQPIEMDDAMDGLTPERIRMAMLRTEGVAGRAARELKVSRSTFYNACKRLGIQPDALRGKPR